MGGAALEAALRRDKVIVASALVTLAALAWAYTLWLIDTMSMGGMEMPGMRMHANPLEAIMSPMSQAWSATEFVLAFAMWAVMMVGMMTPSAAPMILIYARVGRQAERQGKPLAATGFFASGYLLSWIAFSIIATTGQWLLERASLLTPTIESASSVMGGAVLISAGLYQWTPAKAACLKHCQAPLFFIQRHGGFRRDAPGSIRIGFLHGLYCIGCCWALMALLFVGGVMNVTWIAAIAIFVLAEKVIPAGLVFTRVAGVTLIAAGLWMIGTAFR